MRPNSVHWRTWALLRLMPVAASAASISGFPALALILCPFAAPLASRRTGTSLKASTPRVHRKSTRKVT